MIRSRWLAVTGLGAALAVAGCGGGDGGSNSGAKNDMTLAEAANVGGSIATLIGGAFNAAAQFDIAADGTLTDPSLAPGSRLTPRERLVRQILHVGAKTGRSAGSVGPALDGGILGSGSCTPTHSDGTDSDEDGIPDDDLLTFTATNCNYVNEFGVTVVVHGTVEVKDIGSIWGFSIDFNTLTYDLSSSNGSGSLVVTGLYSTSIGANLANSSEAVHVVISASDGQSFTGTASWNFNFVPDDPITAQSTGLPAGSLSATGSWSYTHNSDTWSVILSTPDPIVYDGSCTSNPIFASGSLEGQIAIARTHGFHIQFNGCGETPTLTLLTS